MTSRRFSRNSTIKRFNIFSLYINIHTRKYIFLKLLSKSLHHDSRVKRRVLPGINTLT